MAKTWQIEMGWHCSFCKGLNRGRYKECQACGAPLDHSNFIDLPGSGDGIEFAVRDPELIKQFKAGRDWECRYCRSKQRRDNGNCANCGSDQSDSLEHQRKQASAVLKPRLKTKRKNTYRVDTLTREPKVNPFDAIDPFKPKPPEVPEFHSPWSPEDEEAQQERIDAVMGMGYRGRKTDSDPPEEPEDSTPPVEVEPFSDPEPLPKIPFWDRQRKITAGVMLGVTLLGLLLWVLFRTRIVEGEVTALAWTHTVAVERYQITTGQGFDEDEPGDAFDVVPVGPRHHHYRRVKTGTKQVPYDERYACGTTPRVCTPVCTPNGNGSKTCTERCTGGDTKYCTRTKYKTEDVYEDESVKEMYYHWKVWRWEPNRTVVARGTTDEPYWPSKDEIRLNMGLNPKEVHGQRETEREKRSTQYEVTFTDPDQNTHGYTPSGLDEFMRLRMGAKRKIRVGILRSTEILPE